MPHPPTLTKIPKLTKGNYEKNMKIKHIDNTAGLWKHHFPKHHLLAALVISFGLTLVLALFPDNVVAYRAATLFQPDALQPAESVTDVESAPAGASEATVENVDPRVRLIVGKGDTLSSLLQNAGVASTAVHQIAHGNDYAKELAALKVGDEVDLMLKNGALQEMTLKRSKLEKLTVSRDGNNYKAVLETKKPETKQAVAMGTIDSSLFLAGQKAGLDDRMILKLADIFAYDIDFMLDLQEGDTFSVLYEDLYSDGEHIGQGKILAAEFVNNGKAYQAVAHTDKNGDTQYYAPTGEILRKQFLRTPVDFAKITSYFNLSRMHPVLHKIRAHKGIDYAAPQGTPIRSAGDGKVVFAGVRNGFGNVVMIQHGSAYTTVYGHMQKINVSNGARVKQGQVIGLVGKTGLATGPHLHYEFHVNGVAQNPLANTNVVMVEPLSKSDQANFSSKSLPLLQQLKQRTATAQKIKQLASASDQLEKTEKH